MIKKIENVWKENKELIKKYKIEIGTIFVNISDSAKIEKVIHIHPLYGWILTDKGDNQKVPQKTSDILKEWKIMKI